MLRDILDFLKELAATITWPMAVLIIAFMFRKQLFLAIRALTRKIETSDKITVTKDGMTLESVARKAQEAEEKAEEAQKDVKALAVTGGAGDKNVFDVIKANKKVKEEEKRSNTQDMIKETTEQNITSKTFVPDDPQKNQWGGKSRNGSRELKARIMSIPGSILFYRIELEVISTSSFHPLTGKVKFHLHPTFPNSIQEAEIVNGKATLSLLSYGSFTVGAEADYGETKLELDLGEVGGVTEHFKNN